MTKIVIDANELKAIGDRLIGLARKEGHDTNVIKNDRIFHNEYQFSNKEKLVFEYIKNNPGTTQENVVKNVKEYSRMPILNAISDLEKNGFIVICKDEHRSKKYHLFINRKNELVSLIEDLDHFKKSYFNLIDETKAIMKSLNDKISVSNRSGEWAIVDALLMPYKFLINTWIMSNLILLHKEPIDKNILNKKFAVISETIPEIQIKLYKSISTLSRFYDEDEINGKMFENGLQALTQDNIYKMLHTFEEHEISKSAEEVLDIVWKMNIPLLRVIINSSYSVFTAAEPKRLTDWRKLICSPIYQYIPKTIQNSYMKESYQ
jgi:hypothetical protein